MTITEIRTIQDLMNMDIKIEMSENLFSLVREKECMTLISIEIPEEGFNLTFFIREQVKATISLIEGDDLIDLRDNLPILKEILEII